MTLEKEEQASARRSGEGEPAEPDLGDGHQVRVGGRPGLFSGLFPG
jgi:hypothetical protein